MSDSKNTTITVNVVGMDEVKAELRRAWREAKFGFGMVVVLLILGAVEIASDPEVSKWWLIPSAIAIVLWGRDYLRARGNQRALS